MPTLAEDRAAIGDLLARYCHNFDTGDADGVAGLFTEDGVFDPGVTGFGPFEGREIIRAPAGTFDRVRSAGVGGGHGDPPWTPGDA